MASEHADNLKDNVSRMYNFPDHVKEALHAWVDSVEERIRDTPLRRGDDDRPVTRDEFDAVVGGIGKLSDEMTEVRASIADMHAALSDPSAPKWSQSAMDSVSLPSTGDGTDAEDQKSVEK